MDESSIGDGGPSWAGIYFPRAGRLRIPAGSITISVDDNGSVTSSLKELHITVDFHVVLLERAFKHLESAQSAHAALLTAWASDDETAKSSALDSEFCETLECIVASAIALDAFYALVCQHIKVPPETLAAWRKNRTSRPRQIVEVLRLGFKMGPHGTGRVSRALGDVFKWRDWAVHPAAKYGSPVVYEELGVATEWRYVAFRFENARIVLRIVLSVISQVLVRPRDTYPELVERCAGALLLIEPLVERWEALHGPLQEPPA